MGLMRCDLASRMRMRAGMEARRLLERHMDVIMGMAYPLTKTGNEQDKHLGVAVLQGGVVGRTFSGPHGCRLHAQTSLAVVRDMGAPACRSQPSKDIQGCTHVRMRVAGGIFLLHIGCFFNRKHSRVRHVADLMSTCHAQSRTATSCSRRRLLTSSGRAC